MVSLSRCATISKVATACSVALLVSFSAQSAPLALQDVPLYLLSSADPNVLINMSVETPMGGAAYTDHVGLPAGCTGRQTVSGNNDVGTCYFPAQEYNGYFDSRKCYVASGAQFNPSANAAADHSCTGAWSGNFLNWMSMTAIDMFVWTMTGGNRIVDSTTETVIRRARKTHNDSWFPLKAIGSSVSSAPVASNSVTPYNHGTLYFYNTDFGFRVGTDVTNTRNGSGAGFIAEFTTAVRVCDTAHTPEANCTNYGSYSKPEGLIQRNVLRKRFGAIGYSVDGSSNRHGGVLRANVKYVGPRLPNGAVNSNAEIGTDGILIDNPDGATGGLNSGVINYINKFSDPGYKSLDPVGELFYESIRYFANAGPTPEYSAGLSTGQLGGFHIPTWDDPQQFSCQKNFIVAINDANPWLDKRLPGTAFTTSSITDAGGTVINLDGNDYGEPSNPLTGLNVSAETTEVGRLEGLNNTVWSNTGTWTSGTASGANDSVGGGAGTFDNSCTSKTVGDLGTVMGTCPYPGKQNSYYVAGLAYFANTHDLRPGSGARVNNTYGIQNVKSFFIDTQEYSTNPLDGPKNMLWLAGKYGGFSNAGGELNPFTFDAGDDWDADNDGIPDNYVMATQPQNLVSGLNRAFEFIDSKTSSASSAAINSGTFTNGSRVYQTRFNSADWLGQLLAFRINADGTLGRDPNDGDLSDDEAEWDASTLVPAPTARQIITRDSSGAAVPFQWASFAGATPDTVRQNQLHPTNATIAQAVLNYVRGDGTQEATGASPQFRARVRSKLGDIVSSSPVFVGAPPFRYRESSYATFASAAGQGNRTRMIYVGGNDGMLHGFNENGVEVFAYIPGEVFPRLRNLTSLSYSHQYFVDGSPSMGDAFFGGAWHTMLVGGLNKGGKAIYALDITNPATLATAEASATSIARWEFTDTDLGYTYSQPTIAKLRDGTWVAIFGNGYNSSENAGSNGNAILYIVNIATGGVIAKLDTGVGNAERTAAGVAYDNGLSTPAVVDTNADRIADYVYAGDLYGNMWKFDLTTATPSVAYGGQPLFTAVDASGNRQPITVRPEVTRGPAGAGMVVLFGTGKYLVNADVLSTPVRVQSFYGIIDLNSGNAATDHVDDRASLTPQTITAETTLDPADPDGAGPLPNPAPISVRTTSANPVTNRGWYIDLLSPSGYENEKQVTNPIVRNGNVIFTTAIPTLNPCEPGGRSWLMEMSALTGGRLPNAPFDTNRDGLFTDEDNLPIDTNGDGVADSSMPVSGRAGDDGMGLLQSPGVIDAEPQPGRPVQYKFSPGSSGGIQSITENPGAGATGRQSWRQVR